jgi:predicted dehydrogenase
MRIIQVGMGGFGRHWIEAVLASTEVEYAGFVEVNDVIAGEQAERYKLGAVPVFHTLEDALAAGPVDGVINVTPPAFHREVSVTALEAGIPVLSEKPLADTRASAQEIVRKAEENGVLHMVAQNYRYMVPAQTVKRVLDSGTMGRVGAVGVKYFKGPYLGGFHAGLRYPLLIDMSIHHFDMMRFFLGSDATAIYGRSWNPAWSWHKGNASASAVIEFAGGVVVSYEGSWCATGQETSWVADWRFECENGVILLRDDQVYVQHMTGVLLDDDGYRHYEHGELVAIEPVEMGLITQGYLLHEFYEAVTQGKIPATTCQDNIKSLGMVFGTIESVESGGVVRVS